MRKYNILLVKSCHWKLLFFIKNTQDFWVSLFFLQILVPDIKYYLPIFKMEQIAVEIVFF